MLKKPYYKIIIFCLVILSCSDFLVGPDPDNTPENNFEILWNEFDKYYPFFESKKIDWDSLHNEFYSQINDNTTDVELFNIISDMTDRLKDLHIDILTPIGNHKYHTQNSKYYSLDIIKSNYLTDYRIIQNGNINYGNISDDIGYFNIASFSTNYSRNSFENNINVILEHFSNKSGIIIDVRNNGGGNSENADKVAERFADKKILHSYSLYRNGKEHSDFTDPRAVYIEPGGANQYEGLVVLLTNRNCFSTAEHFILEMRVLPNVTVIGDSSGGSMGSPFYRELPNGWAYRLPRALRIDYNKILYEDIGIPPDILQKQTEIDSINGVDKILEKAIQYLSEN